MNPLPPKKVHAGYDTKLRLMVKVPILESMEYSHIAITLWNTLKNSSN